MSVKNISQSTTKSVLDANIGKSVTVDFLVVAGGGPGGGESPGGAGGLRSSVDNTGGGGSLETAQSLVIGGKYFIKIGAGSRTWDGSLTLQNTGEFSQFGEIYSWGGGRGTNYTENGWMGGSGGAGGWPNKPKGNAVANQGYAGGDGGGGGGSGDFCTGGGGGAGAVGNAGSNNGAPGGTGGAGVICNILPHGDATTASVGEVSGTDVYYAGGGGGSVGNDGGASASGGLGGGGNGRNNGTGDTGNSGDANTGGGSSGVNSGGSGVVIIKYPKNHTISIGSGLTGGTVTSGDFKVSYFTAGEDYITFTS